MKKMIATVLFILLAMVFYFLNSLQASSLNNKLNDKQKLGKLLYFDKNLSLKKNQSCNSCHQAPGFVDPNNVNSPKDSVVSIGSDTSLHGGRNSPSSAYASFSPPFHFDEKEDTFIGGQFWDGRATSLAEQAKKPILNPVEMGMPSKEAVLRAIANSDNINHKKYVKLFKNVFDIQIDPKSITIDNIDMKYDLMAEAIAAFEQSAELNKFNSKYDYYLAKKIKLTPKELRGLELYNNKAKCSACHPSTSVIKTTPPMFTDFTYDNLGIPKSTNSLIANNPPDLGLGGLPEIAAIDPKGEQIGKFKVPSLRNIAITAPYGHNGYFASLQEIVHFYNTRDVETWPEPEVLQNVNREELGNLGLSLDQESDLVEFLKTLTDRYDLAPATLQSAY